MDPVSFLMGLISVVFSVAAFYKANSAQTAVGKAIEKTNAREDFEILQNLIREVERAQEAAKPWCEGAPEKFRKGKDENDDRSVVFQTIDVIRSKAPISLGSSFDGTIETYSQEISNQYQRIVSPDVNENCWQALLNELQGLTSYLRRLERQLKNESIAD